MTIRVKNIQYFDWQVPEELVPSAKNMPLEIIQQLVDEHFDPNDISVDQSGDDYYEFEETFEE